jgi:hypothetical protein
MARYQDELDGLGPAQRVRLAKAKAKIGLHALDHRRRGTTDMICPLHDTLESIRRQLDNPRAELTTVTLTADEARTLLEMAEQCAKPKESTGPSGWCIAELMGRRRLAGQASEAAWPPGFLRLDIPGQATQFYSPKAIYCLTPTDEITAREVAKASQAAPVQRWELRQLEADHDDSNWGDGDE